MTHQNYVSSNALTLSEEGARSVDEFVGRRIRECRRNRGKTLKSLAAMINVSYQQLQKYEHGINRVSAGRLFTIAIALDADIESFFPERRTLAAAA